MIVSSCTKLRMENCHFMGVLSVHKVRKQNEQGQMDLVTVHD